MAKTIAKKQTTKSVAKPASKKPVAKPQPQHFTPQQKQQANARMTQLQQATTELDRERDLRTLTILLQQYGLPMYREEGPKHAAKFIHVSQSGSSNHPYGAFFIPNRMAEGLEMLYVFGVRVPVKAEKTEKGGK